MQNRLLVMGILNVTPDSFSDGGRYVEQTAALAQAERLSRDGADIIDVGGESTRPGAVPISIEQEIERTIPVLKAISERLSVRLSIDTRHYEVAREALVNGASLVNDISAGQDIRMAKLVQETGADIILMHMQGSPQTMQQEPSYPQGVVTEVKAFLQGRVQAFEETGIPKERLWIDPGIGFGKTLEHNLQLLSHLDEFGGIGGQVVIGTSRKSFLAKVLGDPDTGFEFLEAGSLSSQLWAFSKGASVLRVHDVGACQRAVKTWRAIAGEVE